MAHTSSSMWGARGQYSRDEVRREVKIWQGYIVGNSVVREENCEVGTSSYICGEGGNSVVQSRSSVCEEGNSDVCGLGADCVVSSSSDL